MAIKSRHSAIRSSERSSISPFGINMLGIGRIAHDQIREHIAALFSGHDFARLIGEILKVERFRVEIAKPGPDGGVDILASKGVLGFDPPYLCVQVKSSEKPVDVATLRALQGTMETFRASQGLLVAWGGFTRTLRKEARLSHFRIRLWSSNEVIEAIYCTYNNLSPEIQSEIPLERVWILVREKA